MVDPVIFGDPEAQARAQMYRSMAHEDVVAGALMADSHAGYGMPIGGVIAYREHVSPSGVGFDIACGIKAVRLHGVDHLAHDRDAVGKALDVLQRGLSFGVGRVNVDAPDHALFDDPAWEIPEVAALKDTARAQLGTIGSGNHFVDLLTDGADVWVACHFGSRGLGHKIATHYVQAGGGKDGIDVDPVLLHQASDLGQQYIAAMRLAGRYAYAGRDWVCTRVAELLGATEGESVHNHHNFAWHELVNGWPAWVVRKGATPAGPGQRGFVGGSMAEPAAIVMGKADNRLSLLSAPHGAGRVMSRTRAAGKYKGWGANRRKVSEGEVSEEMMRDWLDHAGVQLRGGGLDESPHCYKRLPEVLDYHRQGVQVERWLRPVGVIMAGADIRDPYKD